MSSAISIGLGVAILSIAASIGFIRVDDATYMQWRMIFASGEGLAIAVGSTTTPKNAQLSTVSQNHTHQAALASSVSFIGASSDDWRLLGALAALAIALRIRSHRR